MPLCGLKVSGPSLVKDLQPHMQEREEVKWIGETCMQSRRALIVKNNIGKACQMKHLMTYEVQAVA